MAKSNPKKFKCLTTNDKKYSYKDNYINEKSKRYHGYDDHETIGTSR